jgi:hypothetical protein
MDFERFGKLLDQWRGALTAAGLLLTAAIGVWKQALDLNPRAWSWPELSFVFLAASMIAAVVLRSRDANASRLVEAEALKLDPQSPEQLIGRCEDLDKLLETLTNNLVFLVSESGCGKSALLRAAVAQGPAFTARFLPDLRGHVRARLGGRSTARPSRRVFSGAAEQ